MNDGDKTTGATRQELHETQLALLKQELLTELRVISGKLDGHVDSVEDVKTELAELSKVVTELQMKFVELQTKTKIMLGIVGLGGGATGAGIFAALKHLI